MNDGLAELAAEQTHLKVALERCSVALASRSEDALGRAEEVGALVTQHFRHKDDLYQELRRLCVEKQRPRDLSLVNLLSQNMNVVSDRVLSFFTGLQRLPTLADAGYRFGVVADAVRVRLETEERLLVPMWTRMLAGASANTLQPEGAR
jgi:AcrR family transcriptional regulator